MENTAASTTVSWRLRVLAHAPCGRPRLRLAGFEPDSKDFVSAHDGAANYGVGCFQSVRNISTHRLEVDDALEMLAALSLLARWIGRAIVVPIG